MKTLIIKSTLDINLNAAQKVAYDFIVESEVKSTTLPLRLIEKAFKTLAIQTFEYQLELFKEELYNDVSWEITENTIQYNEPDDIVDIMDTFHTYYEEYLKCMKSFTSFNFSDDTLNIDDSVLKYVIDDIIKFDQEGLSRQEIHDLLREREIFAKISNTAIAYLIIDTLTD